MIPHDKVIKFIIAHIDAGTIDQAFNENNFNSAMKAYYLEPFGTIISEWFLNQIKKSPDYYAEMTGYQRVVTCKNCGGKCLPGKVLNNPLCGIPEFGDNDMRGATLGPAADAIMVDCMKCENCGHSFID